MVLASEYQKTHHRASIHIRIEVELLLFPATPAGLLGWRNSHLWDEPQYLTYCENGGEGAILKNPLAPYRTGLTRNERPTQTWYKIKKFDTVDVQITGFQAGQGKYTGLIGAIVFVNPVTGIIGKCSGMTDEQRIDFTQRSKAGNMFGDWMEIRYFGLTVGTPRHPQFVRLRPDR